MYGTAQPNPIPYVEFCKQNTNPNYIAKRKKKTIKALMK